MTIEELQVLITANTDDLRREINKTNSTINGLKKNAEKQNNGITKAFSKLKKGIIALGIGKVIKESIQVGMDAIESDNLFSVSLGKYADDVYTWSTEVSKALGLNAVEIRKNTGVIYNMTSSMGLAEKQALTMSKGVTLLANDMASFYNLNTEEAFNKIRAGITGETEPLKALGILVDENTIKQVAYSEGIATTGSELTQQQKVLARYVAIMKQTGNAQGDLARTIDSPANMFRRLKTEIQNCATTIGSIFMPIIQTVVPYIISFVKIIGNALNSLASFLGIKSSGLSEETANASSNISGLSSDMSDANKSAKQMKQTLAGFDEITNLNTNTDSESTGASSSGGIGFDLSEYDAGMSSIQDKTTEIVDNIYKKFDKLKTVFDKLKITFSDIWNSKPVESWKNRIVAKINFIKELGTNLGTTLYENVKGTWNNISEDVAIGFNNIGTLWLNVWNDISTTMQMYTEPIVNGISGLFDSIYDTAIGPAIELIVEVWKDFTQILLDWWNKHGQKTLDNIGQFVTQTIKLFQSIYDNVLKPIIEPFLNTLGELWDSKIKGLIETFGTLVAELINGALEIYNKVIVPIVEWLTKILGPAVADIVNTIFNAVSVVVGNIMEFINGLIVALTGLIQFIVGVFTLDWDKAWQGIRNIFKGIFESLSGIVKAVINVIIGILNTLISAFESTVNAIIDAINSIEITNPFNGEEIWSPNIPRLKVGRIPELARGGIVDKPTLSIIGEAGKEAVVPLENNTGWLDKIASKFAVMVSEMADGSNSNASFTSNLIINGRQLASATIEDFNNEAIRRGYKPLLAT